MRKIFPGFKWCERNVTKRILYDSPNYKVNIGKGKGEEEEEKEEEKEKGEKKEGCIFFTLYPYTVSSHRTNTHTLDTPSTEQKTTKLPMIILKPSAESYLRLSEKKISMHT